MTEPDLLQALTRGEDSRQQFKRDATNADGMAPEQIRTGVSNRRNAVLAEHAAHILPYRGMGTGVPRALGAWPQIDLVDEPEINQFRAVVWRTKISTEVTPQVTPQVTPASHPRKSPPKSGVCCRCWLER
jgi:hypothetical protein